jgi:hypothetical protein
MNRRSAITAITFGAAGVVSAVQREALAQAQRTAPDLGAAREATRRGLPPAKITDVKAYRLGVANQNICVAKVFTNEPGLCESDLEGDAR